MATLELDGTLIAEKDNNNKIISHVDQLSEATSGGGITLSHSLKNSSGSEIINSSGNLISGTLGANVSFANIADDAISGDKIHSGTISSSTLDGIKLKSSGNSITKSDGTTAVLSESGGVVTLNNGTIGSGVVFPAGHVIKVTQVKRTTIASRDTTSWVEFDSDYRIPVTPTNNNTRIYLQFYFQTNTYMDSNTLFQFDIRYLVNGSLPTGGHGSADNATYGKLTSDGGTMNGNIGNRLNTHFVGRPGNGYDINDQLTINMLGYDEPAGASRTYGLIYKRESGGSGTLYVNHSAGNNSNWGFMTPMLITATEVQL